MAEWIDKGAGWVRESILRVIAITPLGNQERRGLMRSGPRPKSVPIRRRMWRACAPIMILLLTCAVVPGAQEGSITPRVEQPGGPAGPGGERSPSPSAAADSGS